MKSVLNGFLYQFGKFLFFIFLIIISCLIFSNVFAYNGGGFGQPLPGYTLTPSNIRNSNNSVILSGSSTTFANKLAYGGDTTFISAIDFGHYNSASTSNYIFITLDEFIRAGYNYQFSYLMCSNQNLLNLGNLFVHSSLTNKVVQNSARNNVDISGGLFNLVQSPGLQPVQYNLSFDYGCRIYNYNFDSTFSGNSISLNIDGIDTFVNGNTFAFGYKLVNNGISSNVVTNIESSINSVTSDINNSISSINNNTNNKIQQQINNANSNQAQTNSNLNQVNSNINQVNSNLNQVNSNLNQVNSNLTSSNDDYSSVDDLFSDMDFSTGSIQDFILIPLNFIRDVPYTTCKPYIVPLPFVNQSIEFPCMLSVYRTHFNSFLTFYQMLTNGIISYYLLIKFFKFVKKSLDPLKENNIEVLQL